MANPTRPPSGRRPAERQRERAAKREARRWVWRGLAVAASALGAFLVTGAGAAVGYAASMLKGLPAISPQTFTNLSQPTVVYDVHGQVIGRFTAEGDREPITSVNQVSKNLVNAFIAAEDKTFYKNIGINPMAMARAFVQDVLHHQIESGASTITQQTVKLALFPDQQRTLKRKIQEIALALEVNHMLTKDEILTDYMNWVYMGQMGSNPVYGVKAAAQILFHKDPKDLNLPEAALLAAIPNNASLFSPYDHLDNTISRQHYILEQMRANGMIDEAQYQAALRYDIKKDIQPEPKTSAYAQHPYLMIDEIRPLVAQYLVQSGRYASEEDALKALPTAGYKIYTSIDLKLQNQVEGVLSDDKLFGNTNQVAKDERNRVITQNGKPVVDLYEAGVTLIDNETGGILAVGGGRDYNRDSVDHTIIPRQPGSSIKPLLDYGPAIDQHRITAATPILDAPVTYPGSDGPWSPQDDDGEWHGVVTVRQALTSSYNVPAIKVYDRYSRSIGSSYLQKMGISPDAKTLNGRPTLAPGDLQNLASAIGGLTNGLTVQQMTSAYTVFPNQGVWRHPYLISKIVDRDGNPLYQFQPTATKVFSPQTAYVMTDILHDVVYAPGGTAQAVGAHFPGDYIAGKTGTTDDLRDGWFIGYTQKYTLGIWMGYNHHQVIDRNVYNLKFTVWNKIMDPILKADPPKAPFPQPPGIVSLAVCKKSGMLPTDLCKQDGDVYTELFIQGTEPASPCTAHVQALYTVVNGKRYLATTNTPPGEIRTGIFIIPPEPVPPGTVTPDSAEYLPTEADPRGGQVLTPSGQATVQPPLPAPAQVQAALTPTGVRIQWSAVPGATGYTVWRADAPGGPYVSIAGPISGTAFTDTHLPPAGGTVYYQVYAMSASGISPPSQPVPVVVPASAPGEGTGNTTGSSGDGSTGNATGGTGGAGGTGGGTGTGNTTDGSVKPGHGHGKHGTDGGNSTALPDLLWPGGLPEGNRT
ncbi:transglycosylase domain-containing protein [Alicyclobacillus sp.]|uniref:transglycosylase domain-containing protein n=1 Tax=Alicyclobacillus sp. TaxID=61169 RepID=UPI0025C3DFFB|nr:transglycosylase domain-containing protein [Alicyclobacillus sp.]MCL6516494.1 transglycosylase domain-containing protein [Alicyclobacillus sp.]